MAKTKNKREKKKLRPAPKPKEEVKPDDEKAFDFGGLPDRDLKKNLGCG